MSQKIHYTKPSITDLEVQYATDAAQNGWGEKCYDYIHRFEAGFAEYLGVKHVIATSSCTGAMHMGMSALGIGAGDEVILADTNWIASVSSIVHLGATPVFVDILGDTWCLDPALVEQAITPRTKAILAVHIYGNLCEMDELRAIGRKHQIPVIEDSAEAIGSVYHGARAGSMGAFSSFSFHGTKTLTTGEGGVFATNDTDLFEHVLTLSNHGRSQAQVKQFWADVIGFKFKMSNIQAAIGCAQLERIEDLTGRKQEILARYRKGILAFPGVSMNPEKTGVVNGAWMPTVVFDSELGISRELLMAEFAEANIDARVFFWPLSSLPMFSDLKCNENAYSIAGRAMNLPSYHDLSDAEQERVIGVIATMMRR